MTSTEPVDGRLARSARTRSAILDALLARFIAGELRPTAPAIAAQAGVSVRTVWQHFDDLQSLMTEAGRREMDRALGFVAPIDPGLPLVARVEALLDQRQAMFEELAPVWRAARMHEPASPEVRAAGSDLYRAGRQQLCDVFAAELQGHHDRLPALEVSLSWAAWEVLRSDLGLPPERARASVAALVVALLQAQP